MKQKSYNTSPNGLFSQAFAGSIVPLRISNWYEHMYDSKEYDTYIFISTIFYVN
jgi:hypothetical protein